MVVENKEKRRNNVTRKPPKEKRLRDKQLEDCLFYFCAAPSSHFFGLWAPAMVFDVVINDTYIFRLGKKRKKRGIKFCLEPRELRAAVRNRILAAGRIAGQFEPKLLLEFFCCFWIEAFSCVYIHTRKKNKIKSQGSVTEMSHWGSFCYQSRLFFS